MSSPVPAEEAGAKRAGFASGYPESETLDVLLRAFDAGDFAAVREGTSTLLATETDDAILKATTDLRRRIYPGATAIYILALSVGLLLFLAGYYWLRVQP
ncbi:MAG: hypothetical protein VB934_15325 [Polyangiaceae bacterium]